MALAEYRRKRRFAETPEPQAGKARCHGPLRFVVQMHQARRLHYDFRLELDGVLKSWAVPKGPSLDPGVRRLAVMVEDHPLDYRTFEGVIPAGNYGAGHVIVWDHGTYRAAGAASRSESERLLRDGLRQGRLSIELTGTKLRGAFTLVRLKSGKGNDWLLLKRSDSFAGSADVTADDKSAVSGRHLAEVAAGRRPRKVLTRGAAAARFPHGLRPMLATPVDQPFDRAGWLFEIKWDGYRAVAEVQGGRASLHSRTGRSFTAHYPPAVEALRRLGHDAVLDGEVVVFDDAGRSHFQLLQQYRTTGNGRLSFVAFDLLYLDGRDLRPLPLVRRKAALAKLVSGLPGVVYSDHVETNGVAYFEAARARGLEGVMAKDGASPYRCGVRGLEWLKVKTRKRQEAVIGGFTAPRGGRKDFGALVLGVYEGTKLVYVGHTGGGFDAKSLSEVCERLRSLEQRRCPFATVPATNAKATWVRPELVCEVAFQEWTADGVMRQPIFLGLRDDKPVHTVRREVPKHVSTRPAGLVRSDSTPTSIGAARPAVTNPNKVYWPGEGLTKGDLIDYYREVAPVLLPHLRDRPQTLHRHPDGIDGDSFFQKDVGRRPPPAWVETAVIPSDDGDLVRYLLCQDERSLVYLANLGCIELNPWLSRVGSLDRPDSAVIDLDPQDLPFERVVEAAVEVRRVLEAAGVEAVCKTSGKRGLHVYVPLGAKYPTDVARGFAELVARVVHDRLPDTTSLVRSPALRRGRVYLDYLQNRRGQTVAAAYSVRPVAGARVSAPLRWSEVRRGLDPGKFTLRSMPRCLDRVGDLWKPVLGRGVDLSDCLSKLQTSLTKR